MSLSNCATPTSRRMNGCDRVRLQPFWLRWAAAPAMEHRLLLNGKYKNHTFSHAEADRGYCNWVLGSPSLPLSLRLFQHYLKQRHGGIFFVGKHKGRFFDEVLQSDPAYTLWAMGLHDASGNLRDYQFYAASNYEAMLYAEGRDRSRMRCAVLLAALFMHVPAAWSERSAVNAFDPSGAVRLCTSPSCGRRCTWSA